MKLGLQVAISTVRKYRPVRGRQPNQTWRAFLKNHAGGIAAMDFFAVPTATFRLLCVLLGVRRERRIVVHWNITELPTTEWNTQQVVETFPFDSAPDYLVRDRDSIYGGSFVKRVNTLRILEKVIAPRAPWQNPIAERLIGSIRRECLDRQERGQFLQSTMEEVREVVCRHGRSAPFSAFRSFAGTRSTVLHRRINAV
ncbi:MAG: transposase, partial [Verrucomicrobiales bacterium]|nr:transposase [Verrucomicrobiales bacterium]